MDRRNFFKISALTGAVAALESCGSPDHQLIRFVPDEDLIPGIADWKNGVCTLCPAGCGLQVRVMQGEAEVIRNGQLGLIKMGTAKKLEGNPMHPVNQGKLCARGQAGLQALYNPDRVKAPLKRMGSRGSGQFQEITWDDAMKELMGQLTVLRTSNSAAALAVLTRARRGQRNELTARFLKAFGAPAPLEYEALEDAVLRQANLASFGHAALPTLSLANADYLISFGADFLGTWNSPVAQAVGYGQMRNGRPSIRGRFAQVEPRMSQTGANADEWLGCKPGTEGAVALAIANVILSEKLVHDTGSHAGSLIDGWSKGLPDYTPANVEKTSGVPADLIQRLARAAAKTPRACAVIGGPALAHTNGMFSALAVNALESLLDANAGDKLISFMPQPPVAGAAPAAGKPNSSFAALSAMAQSIMQGGAQAPKVLLIDDVNPVFSAPPSLQVRDAILKVPYVVSFGSFLDETSGLADLVLPDSAALESWVDDIPESGSTQMVVSLAAPAVMPLFNTRPTPDVLLDAAKQLGGPVGAALPYKTFDEMLKAAYTPLRKQAGGSIKADNDDDFWSMMQDMGGWWSNAAAKAAAAGAAGKAGSAASGAGAEPQFDGDAGSYPFYFLPYASQSFRDGSLANLPWLQEMPDVLSTAMWSSWIEINPRTADKLNLKQGDWVEVTSPHGSLRTGVVLSPGIGPDAVAMAMGQGHQSFGRYASGIGANALSIVGTLTEKQTGSLAWSATRVRLARVGGPEEAKLILFSGGLSRFPEAEEERR